MRTHQTSWTRVMAEDSQGCLEQVASLVPDTSRVGHHNITFMDRLTVSIYLP